MRVNEINSRIESILDELKIGTPAKKIYDLMVRRILMQDNKIHQRPVDRIQVDISQCEARIRKLEDSYADETIYLEMLNNGLKRYRTELKLLKQEIETNREDHPIYQQYLKKGIDLLSSISTFYQKADATTKKKVLCSIFPENLFFSKEKNRTPRINEAVRLILTTSKDFSQQKTGQLFKNLTLSGEVEITGVEPVTFCMPCKRSSQLS